MDRVRALQIQIGSIISAYVSDNNNGFFEKRVGPCVDVLQEWYKAKPDNTTAIDKILEPLGIDLKQPKDTLVKVIADKCNQQHDNDKDGVESFLKKLQDLGQLLYKSLIQEYAYKKDQESYQVLATVFKDLAYLVTNPFVTDNGTDVVKNLDTKIRYLTDAAIFYQYAISIITEHIIPPDTNADNTDQQVQQWQRKQNDIYTELGSIKQEILAISAGNSVIEVSTVTASELKNEIIRLKAPLTALRSVAQQWSDTIEEYRLQSQLASNHDIQQQLEIFYINKSRLLFHNIAKTLKEFLAGLYKEAAQELAAVGIAKPCDYAVIGLGSLAVNQATPYSDLEFAILTEDEDYKNNDDFKTKNYFINLTHLVHLKVINLGETPIPISKYGVDLDHLVHKGVNFDLGSKTPLGSVDYDKLDLIGTIEHIMQYVRSEENQIKNINILESVIHVYGEVVLTNGYKEVLRKFLNSKVPKTMTDVKTIEIWNKKMPSELQPFIETLLQAPNMSEPTLEKNIFNYEAKAIKSIQGDLTKFQPCSENDEGKLFDVKQEIYRLSDRLLHDLGMYYGIQGHSVWDTIEQLYSSGVIHEKGAYSLKLAATFACHLRLSTYLKHQAQRENVSQFSLQASQEDNLHDIFCLPKEDLKEKGGVFQYFYITLPLYYAVSALMANKNLNAHEKKVFLSKYKFYEESDLSKGLVYHRLCQYNQARINLEQAVKNLENSHEQQLQIQNVLSKLYMIFGESDRAIVLFECNHFINASYVNNPSHHDNIAYLGNMGKAYYVKGDCEKAIEYFKTALRILQSTNSTSSKIQIDIATFYDYLGDVYRTEEDYKKAFENYEQALKIKAVLYSDNPRMYAQHIAISYDNLGHYHESIAEYDKALKNYEQALEKRTSNMHKGTPHPDIATSYDNIGHYYLTISNYNEALKYYTDALHMRYAIYKVSRDQEIDHSNFHPDIAVSYNNLGDYHRLVNEYDQALKYYNDAFEIQKSKLRQPNHDICTSLNNIGSIHAIYGDYTTSRKYHTDVVEIQKCIFGKKLHTNMAISSIYLGKIYYATENYKEAEEHFENANNILQSIHSGIPHSLIAACANHLGNIYESQKDYKKARKYYTAAKQVLEKIYTAKDHIDLVAMTYNNLASIELKEATTQNIVTKARLIRSYITQSIEIQVAIYKQLPSILSATSYKIFADLHYFQNSYDPAFQNFNKAISMLETIYAGRPHSSIAALHTQLGDIFQKQKKYHDALKCYNASLLQLNKFYSNTSHPDQAIMNYKIGCIYHELKRDLDALKYHSNAAFNIISMFHQNSEYPIIKESLIASAKQFCNSYAFKEHIVKKIFYCAIHGLDFNHYWTHYELASSLQQKQESRLDDIIESYRLALIFMSKEDMAIFQTVYRNLTKLTGANEKSIKLWIEVSNGNIENVRTLLLPANMQDININVRISNTTPLIQAIIKANIDVISELLMAKADVNIPDMNGNTPMHIAHYKANIDAIRLLLEYNAHINAQNYDGKAPLHCLVEIADVAIEDKVKIIQAFLPQYKLILATKAMHVRCSLNSNHPVLEHDPRLPSATSATAEIAAAYDPSNPLKNFSNGHVINNMISMTTQIRDNLTNIHKVIFSFGKISEHRWCVEVYVPQNADNCIDVVTLYPQQAAGLVTNGWICFNDDGTLQCVSTSLSSGIFYWNNGALPSVVQIDFNDLKESSEDDNRSVVIHNMPDDESQFVLLGEG